MSFYLNNDTPNRPCPLKNSGPGCVCEKVCIEVNKVFDACLTQTEEKGVQLVCTNFNPPAPVQPLTYISIQESNLAPTISNLSITRLQDRPNFATVSYTLSIPVVITYRDANSTIGTCNSTFVVNKSCVLFVPQPAFYPATVDVTAELKGLVGTYSGNNTFTVDICLLVITKIVGKVDLLVPSYGYCPIPLCCESNPACPGYPTSPLFPTASN